MSPFPVSLFLTLLLSIPSLLRSQETAPLPAHPLAEKLLVVYNRNLPASESLAKHYAQLRKIPPERVLALDCSLGESISRQAFQKEISAPINRYLLEKKWIERQPGLLNISGHNFKVQRAVRNQIWAIALIHGIPLKIEEDSSLKPEMPISSALQHNRASVDSELSTLPIEGLPRSGLITNSFFSDQSPHAFSQNDANQMILVCRLDAPTPEIVRRMMDDAVATEKLELTGRVHLDARGIQDPASGYKLGDDWIDQAARIARTAGLETTLDNVEATVPETALWDQTALYFGWYASHLNGPMARPGFRFRRGAVAYHIHSFSADTLRSTTQNWAGPLLAKGASATMGSVYEPYLRFTPDPAIFLRSLVTGYTFAESAYQSQLALSWTITMIGDPLYRPFPRHYTENVKLAEKQQSPDYPWLLLRTARRVSSNLDPAPVKLEKLAQISRLAKDSPVFQEGYADILRELKADPNLAVQAYENAFRQADSPLNKIRAYLKLADTYAAQGETAKAIACYETLMAQLPAESRFHQVPQIALDYSSKVGWQNLSPALSSQLSPVQEKKPTEPATESGLPAPPAFKPSVSGGGLKPAVSP
ncbi:MAG: TIGR03790 family protein [Blastochloris sp.]|nr:TIGR03790 family protein [Blastochloris sp.]